jgi:hypothetical protein
MIQKVCQKLKKKKFQITLLASSGFFKRIPSKNLFSINGSKDSTRHPNLLFISRSNDSSWLIPNENTIHLFISIRLSSRHKNHAPFLSNSAFVYTCFKNLNIEYKINTVYLLLDKVCLELCLNTWHRRLSWFDSCICNDKSLWNARRFQQPTLSKALVL